MGVVLLIAAAGCGSSAAVGTRADAGADAQVDAPAGAADAGPADADAGLDAAVDAAAGPLIVPAWRASEISADFGDDPSSNYPCGGGIGTFGPKFFGVLARNAAGEPPGAKAFVIRAEDVSPTGLHLTFGIAERLDRDGGPPLYRFVADPPPVVADTDRTMTDGGIIIGRNHQMTSPFALAITPNAPDPPSIVSAAPSAGHSYVLNIDLRPPESSGVGLVLGNGSDAFVTPAAACKVWVDGFNLVDALDNGRLDHSVNTDTCTSYCVGPNSKWGFQLWVYRSEPIDLLVDQD